MGKRERDTAKVDKTPSNPLSEDAARAIVTAASQEATDVLASMITDDPGKKPTKPRTLKDAVKDTVIQLVGCPTPPQTPAPERSTRTLARCFPVLPRPRVVHRRASYPHPANPVSYSLTASLKDDVKDMVIQLVGSPPPACVTSPAPPRPRPAWCPAGPAARTQQIPPLPFVTPPPFSPILPHSLSPLTRLPHQHHPLPQVTSVIRDHASTHSRSKVWIRQ